jgi:hypothetical protein
LQETHAEKEAKRLHSKADPTLAISEAEPCMSCHSLRVRVIRSQLTRNQLLSPP